MEKKDVMKEKDLEQVSGGKIVVIYDDDEEQQPIDKQSGSAKPADPCDPDPRKNGPILPR